MNSTINNKNIDDIKLRKLYNMLDRLEDCVLSDETLASVQKSEDKLELLLFLRDLKNIIPNLRIEALKEECLEFQNEEFFKNSFKIQQNPSILYVPIKYILK